MGCIVAAPRRTLTPMIGIGVPFEMLGEHPATQGHVKVVPRRLKPRQRMAKPAYAGWNQPA
jgi:hypothetical protein